jgi:hypothetical protein
VGYAEIIFTIPQVHTLVQFRCLQTPKDSYEQIYYYISISYIGSGDTEGHRQTRLDRVLEARVGIEPAYTALQAAA